jgi:predicted kinase
MLIVNGSAASGKTTLAHLLGSKLQLPVLSRDQIKESLMDSLGSPARARSRELGAASYAVLYSIIEQLLGANLSLIVESNFSHGKSESELVRIAANAKIVQLHCRTSDEEVFRRYRERAESGTRHPGHHDTDAETLADLGTSLRGSRHEPLMLDAPLLIVDTTDGYRPDFDEIVAFAKNHLY